MNEKEAGSRSRAKEKLLVVEAWYFERPRTGYYWCLGQTDDSEIVSIVNNHVLVIEKDDLDASV